MKYLIKNMVSMRCKMQVKSLLEDLGFICVSIDAGEFELTSEISNEDLIDLGIALHADGYELLNEQEAHIVKSIKSIVAELVHYSDKVLKIDLNEYLNNKLNLSADEMLLLFSSVKGISIAQYFMLQKIERAKELIIYDALDLKLIADRLDFEDVSDLKKEFQVLSGLLPDFFENLRTQRLKKIKV